MSNIDPHAHNPLDSHDVVHQVKREPRGIGSDRISFSTPSMTLMLPRRQSVWVRVRGLVWLTGSVLFGFASIVGWSCFWVSARFHYAFLATAFTIVAIVCILHLGNRKGGAK